MLPNAKLGNTSSDCLHAQIFPFASASCQVLRYVLTQHTVLMLISLPLSLFLNVM